ncbi:hypothetical protein EZJ49_11125 [Bdellovibrio bacteriovorus]|uniref:hypothetical protein n=1 Tax=Bdellovibrio bacteriovorus TaxID=959 RepID=UPI0021D172F6|nr:hypothetical protein [Bdellovibrio bacteriovorus]UXR63627.1 hypothetical protein EZJ49_11125 [Bdellovibrio bacteriovorus]
MISGFLSAVLIGFFLTSPSFAVTPKEADLAWDQAHQRVTQLVENLFNSGQLTDIDRLLLVSDLNGYKTAYKAYANSAAQTHTYLKNKKQREEHYANKMIYVAGRLVNLANQHTGSIADLTEEVTDFVPADQKCGVPVDLPCVAQEVERRMDGIYVNISRRSSKVRAKFKTVADQGLHAAELYARILASLRTDGGALYPAEYIYDKDRLVMSVKQEIEEGY